MSCFSRDSHTTPHRGPSGPGTCCRSSYASVDPPEKIRKKTQEELETKEKGLTKKSDDDVHDNLRNDDRPTSMTTNTKAATTTKTTDPEENRGRTWDKGEGGAGAHEKRTSTTTITITSATTTEQRQGRQRQRRQQRLRRHL